MLQRQVLHQKELARRWGLSHRTLERWRYTDQGPTFLKLGGRIVYRLADIETFETSNLQRAVEADCSPPGTAGFSPRTRAVSACR